MKIGSFLKLSPHTGCYILCLLVCCARAAFPVPAAVAVPATALVSHAVTSPATELVSDAVVAPDEFPQRAAQFLRRVRLSPARATLVSSAAQDVEYTLHAIFPGCKAELFGSIAAGLGIEHSDIDISVTLSPNDTAATLPPAELVLEASDIMMKRPELFEVILTLPQAKVPIVTVTHLPTDFKVDISFNNYNGVRNSKLIHHMMSLDERARDLAQILKYWARLRHITGRTMLPSYGIVTMAIFFLQQKEILPSVSYLQRDAEEFYVNNWNMGFAERNYETENDESLCDLLRGFFRYYSEFDYSKYMVSPFVGRQVEVDLFRDVGTVPEEFTDYILNVSLNISQPLILNTPLIQDSFEHNSNLAYRIRFLSRRALVELSILNATESFQEDCSGFLDTIIL